MRMKKFNLIFYFAFDHNTDIVVIPNGLNRKNNVIEEDFSHCFNCAWNLTMRTKRILMTVLIVSNQLT